MVAAQLNRIERDIVIRAPRSRVWRALTTVPEFCQWFSAESKAPVFEPGVRADLISRSGGKCDGQSFIMDVVEMVPETRFAWRWHPGTVKPGEDLSAEPTTLVEFTLRESPGGGTHVTVVETGFESLFADRRSRVFEQNDNGWQIQLGRLADYVQ